jgi:hypothetical protein
MAGLDPAIHVFVATKQDVDARHKAGHDGSGNLIRLWPSRSIAMLQIEVMRLTRHLRPWANRLARLPRTRDNSSGSASVTDLGHKPQSQPKHQVEPPVSSEAAREGRPVGGASPPRKNKEPRRSGAGGGTSFGVFGPPWGRGSRGGSRFALIRTISHRPRRGCDGHHILCDCRLPARGRRWAAPRPLPGRAGLSILRNIDLDQSLFPTYSRGRILSKTVDGTSVGGADLS